MINDTAHWQNLSPPLSPNKHEVDVYRDLIIGYDNVYLLGKTKELIPYCDLTIDLNPVPIFKEMNLHCDWNSLPLASKDYPEWGQLALLGDGVVNLMGIDFVPKVLKSCDTFITRIFHKQFPGMKYAQHFPSKFAVQYTANKPKAIIKTQEDISIVVWSAR